MCLSCFFSWSISCRPSAITSPHSLSAATTRCFVQLDQSPTSCVLGFHLPHLAAPSLPVASSSLLVIFISFSQCSFYFNRSLFFQPMLLDAVRNMFGALTLLCHCRFFAWIYSGKPANGSVPLVSTKLWTAISLFVEQIYSLKEAERKYTFYFFYNSRRQIGSSFWLHKRSLAVLTAVLQSSCDRKNNAVQMVFQLSSLCIIMHRCIGETSVLHVLCKQETKYAHLFHR